MTSGNIQVAMIEDIYGPVSNLVFKNNIFIGQYRGINSVSTGSGISGLTVKNNTFKNMAEEGVQLLHTTNSRVQYNIFSDVGMTGTSYLCMDAASRSSLITGHNSCYMSDGSIPDTYCGKDTPYPGYN